MHERRFAWALLATVAVSLGACASDGVECHDETCHEESRVEMTHTLSDVTHSTTLDALDATMAGVAVKPIWSHRIAASDVKVEGAWLDANDLFVLTTENGGRALHRIEADSGVHRWVLEIGSRELSQAPGFGEAFVTVVTRDGLVQAVNRRTGARGDNLLWGRLDHVVPTGPVTSSDRTLFVPSAADDRLHALDPNTGASGWHYRADDLITSGPVVTPRLPRRLVVVGTLGGEVIALPPVAHTGRRPTKPAWERMILGEVAGPMTVSSTVREGRLEVSLLVPCEDYGLYCLDAATGESRWVYRTTAPFRSKPTEVDGKVFARNTKRLAAVDAATGRDAWKRAGAGEELFPFESYDHAIAGSDGRVYLAKGTKVSRVSAATGHIEQTLDLGGTFSFVPAGGKSGLLIGVAADGGIVAWK